MYPTETCIVKVLYNPDALLAPTQHTVDTFKIV